MINSMNDFLKQGIYEKDNLQEIREKIISIICLKIKKGVMSQQQSKPPAFAQVVR
jgi:hypothetical protein